MITPSSFRTFREHRALVRRALDLGRELTPLEDKLYTRERRLEDLRFAMSAGRVAWALVVEPRVISVAIRSGRLPAEPEDLLGGRFRWRILRSDVLRFAAELDAGVPVSPKEEERLERMRVEPCDGRGGEPR